MKNKILLLALILTFSSCGIFISVTDTGSSVTEIQVETSFDEVTKFIGKYEGSVAEVGFVERQCIENNVLYALAIAGGIFLLVNGFENMWKYANESKKEESSDL